MEHKVERTTFRILFRPDLVDRMFTSPEVRHAEGFNAIRPFCPHFYLLGIFTYTIERTALDCSHLRVLATTVLPIHKFDLKVLANQLVLPLSVDTTLDHPLVRTLAAHYRAEHDATIERISTALTVESLTLFHNSGAGDAAEPFECDIDNTAFFDSLPKLSDALERIHHPPSYSFLSKPKPPGLTR